MLELEIVSIKPYSETYLKIKGTNIPIGNSDYSSDEIRFYFPVRSPWKDDIIIIRDSGRAFPRIFEINIPLFGEPRKRAIESCRQEVQELLNKELQDVWNKRELLAGILDGTVEVGQKKEA